MIQKLVKKDSVNLKELRENMETYIKRVETGESIMVYRRTTPLFKLTPVNDPSEEWETVVNFLKETGKGEPLSELIASINKYGQKRKVS